MMWGYGDGWGMMFGGLWMLLVWGAIILLAVWGVNRIAKGDGLGNR